MKLRTLPLLVLLLLPSLLSAQVGIGQWRSHLAYGQINTLCLAGSEMYAAAANGLISVDTATNVVTRHDKTTDLNDAGIATLAYDPESRCLVVAYTNSNLDLLHGGHTYNISDIKRSALSGDKSIHSIRFHNRRAYLACAFGIVVVDLQRHEIEDTYYIGDGGDRENVFDIAFTSTHILALTAHGLKRASLEERYLHLASHWHTVDMPLLEGCDCIEPYADGLMAVVALPEGTILVHLSQVLELIDTLRVEPFNSMRICNGQIVLSRDGEVELLHATRLGPLSWLSTMDARDALLVGRTLWIGHGWAGLVSIDLPTLSLSPRTPSSPPSDNVYSFTPFRDRLFLCQGGKTSTYANAYQPPSIGLFENEKWTTLFAHEVGSDILSVAVNPKDKGRLLAASWGGGIAELENDEVVAHYDNSNTPVLTPLVSGDYTTLRTGAVCFSPKGDAWIANSQVDNALVVRRKDGTWESFYTNNMLDGKEVDKILYDTVHNFVWFAGRPNRLFVSDGQGKMAWVDPNQGSKMETSTVTCLAQDHDGTLWIGTNKGLKIITNAYQAFANGGFGEKAPVSCSNITISNGDFAEYLMAYESITCLAVDGANRKWVGTAQGGLYLISANGQEELLHFTAANSPLFSNKILCLGVQPNTGEVFIGTPYGTQSYRSTATYAGSYVQEEITVFPNPVEPDYEGPIAIRGFSRNALVHISDAAGHVVFSGRADGGQAVWNGRTLQGQRAASGVYFVFASDDQGQNRAVGKILLLR